MQFRVFIVFVIIVYNLLSVFSSAQNKVVVIPLMEELLPLEPYAPMIAESPPDSAFANTIVENQQGLHEVVKML